MKVDINKLQSIRVPDIPKKTEPDKDNKVKLFA
jgi:hypothetical protein